MAHGSELVALSLADGQVLGRWVAADSSPEHSFGDVAVAANGDVFVSDTRTPAVLRLRSQGGQAVPAMGAAAVRALVDEINGTPAPRAEYVFRPELVVRGSTAAARR